MIGLSEEAKQRYRTRCMDCASLIEGDNGEWICDEAEEEIYWMEDCSYWTVTCEVVTGYIGSWLDSEMDIPDEAKECLEKAYHICAAEL